MKTPKPNGITIHLDRPDISYFPGETVCGKVVALFKNVLKNIKCVKLSIHVEGKASTFSRGRTSATEQYFSKDISLFENDNFRTTPSEDTSFPFRFDLPPNLPSSFSSKLGTVSYTITAKLESSDFKKSHPHLSSTLPFQVTGLLDLNRDRRISDKVSFSKAKTNGCLWGKNGPVGFKVTIPRKGYIPGEAIHLSVEMTNTSKHQIKRTSIQLIQSVTCHSKKGKPKSVHTSVVEESESGPGVKSGEYKIRACTLNIPQTPPTGLAGCKLFEVSYKLAFEMDLGGIHSKLSSDTPILIGSIPIRTNSPELVPIEMIRSQLLNKDPSDSNLESKETNNNNTRSPVVSKQNRAEHSTPPIASSRRVSFAVQEILSSENSSVSEFQDTSSSDEDLEIRQHRDSVQFLKLIEQAEDNEVPTKDLGLLDFPSNYVRVYTHVQTTVVTS